MPQNVLCFPGSNYGVLESGHIAGDTAREGEIQVSFSLLLVVLLAVVSARVFPGASRQPADWDLQG